jgi:hypothetical protein
MRLDTITVSKLGTQNNTVDLEFKFRATVQSNEESNINWGLSVKL